MALKGLESKIKDLREIPHQNKILLILSFRNS